MDTSVFWNYKIENIKKMVTVKDEVVMVLNLRYPVFSQDMTEGKDKAFICKINKFYSHIAEKYSKAILSKYPAKAARIYTSNGKIKLSFLMNCTISFNTQKLISVFSDLSYFDGNTKKSIRFSQNWSYEKSAILPSSYIFENTFKSKRYITGIITEIATHNMEKRDFSYYSDFDTIIKRKFAFDNFYFVPNGIAFFYNTGVLSSDALPTVFVIHPEEIDQTLKIFPW